MGELSQALSVPLSTATRIVNWWVDTGLAKRLPDPDDRRIVRIALTDNGRRFHETIEDYLVKHMESVVSCLTASDQQTLMALFEKIGASLGERRP